jgi:NADPH-dependent glutamate synthase beta subunit-like oxidoreductase
VAVVGGGNTSVDVARALKRCGAEEVHLITHNGLPWDAEDPMHAIAREVRQAMEEGVIIHANCGAERLLLRGNRVIGVAHVAMKKMRGADGKWHRHAFQGTEQVLMVDEVIPAIGQTVDPAGFETLLQGQPFFAVDQWGRVASHEGLYAGGDARSGSIGMVSASVGDGRRAAWAIHADLCKSTLAEERRPLVPVSALHLQYFESAPRAEPAILPLEQRIGEAEIEQSLNARQALDEAVRCLSCGNCMICDNCWTFCPDQAVLKLDRILESDGSPYVFDMAFCKGCGICANECPTAFIRMAPEQD